MGKHLEQSIKYIINIYLKKIPINFYNYKKFIISLHYKRYTGLDIFSNF